MSGPLHSASGVPPYSEVDNRTPFCFEDEEGSWRGDVDLMAGDANVVAPAYADLVKELLAAEDARVARLEDRAVTVITSSGALVTLLLALAALVTKSDTFKPPRAALLLAAGSAAAFLLAGLGAMWANVPRKKWSPTPDSFAVELWDRWNLPEPYDPLKKATATRILLWDNARDLTRDKAHALLIAVAAQAVAVALLAVAAVIVLV